MRPLAFFSFALLVAWLSLVAAACQGDTGPAGPEGPPGEPGEPGPPPGGGIEPEIFGLVGRIMEPNLVPV